MSGVLVDANLLCLLTVGATQLSAIAHHARLRAFDRNDFDNLTAIFERLGDPILCPHVLAETSNLIAYRETPPRAAQFRRTLATIVERCAEQSEIARVATNDRAYARLGMTDAVLLVLTMNNTWRLLSDDLHLCEEAGRRRLPSINYNHIREGSLRIDQL